MKFLYSDEPIVVCSTCNLANAAISVIRISGFIDINQFTNFFTINSGPIEPRKVYYTTLKYGDKVFDDICLTFFKAPNSYNGENILELSTHGNVLNVQRIIKLFTDYGGCRLATPGEFTYRALKNKKLSLSQVEGLDLFLNANSGYALDEGLSLLSGDLHHLYSDLYQAFLKHKSSLELSIDFSDDVGEDTALAYFKTSLDELKLLLDKLNRRVNNMGSNILQPEIVLTGLPNSGKSSFFNFLLRDERAIVSALAGTTRDYISEHIEIEGVRYKLIDTAGLREAVDLIELEGIQRTRQKMLSSFFTILLINPFETDDSLKELLDQHFDLMFFTHKDVDGFELQKQALTSLYPQLGSIGACNLRELDPSLEKYIFTLINKKYLSLVEHKPILLDRHKLLISKAFFNCLNYEKVSLIENDVAILSHELNNLGHCLSELVGIVSPDQLLESIFSNFCIGK